MNSRSLSFDSNSECYYDYLLKDVLNGVFSIQVEKEVVAVETPEKEKSLPVPTVKPPKVEAPPKDKKTKKRNLLTCDYPGCCYICDTPACMSNHKRSHTKETIYSCSHPDCHAQFSSKNALKYHEAMHDGIQLFRCPYKGCDYCCSNKQYLPTHIRTHTGDNPFKCTYPGCTYSCKQKPILARHMKTHNPSLPYRCKEPRCTFACSTSAELNAHIMKVHDWFVCCDCNDHRLSLSRECKTMWIYPFMNTHPNKQLHKQNRYS